MSATTKTNPLSKSLGTIHSYEKTKNGILGKTGRGDFKVVVYTPQIIRVHITFDGGYDEHSYAVVATPDETTFELHDHGNELIIKTTAIELRLTKNPARFNFYNNEGKLVNQDDPGFGSSIIGEQVTTYKTMQPGERFVGLGEKTGPLDRRGQGYQHWNTDNFGYGPEADPLYCSTPFYIGIHSGLVYGIYFDNSHKTFFNFGASNNRFSSFSADTGDMNYYYIHADTVAELITAYTHLTGRMEMPPLWGLGYQQCRYSYYPEAEVTTLAKTFIDKKIPADVIVLDIHYMDEYKIFSWDKKSFPDPQKMLDKLDEDGFKVVVMCDPGIKIKDGYGPYESGLREDLFIKYPDGSPYSGEVWAGWCHFPDFTKERTREWWKENMAFYTDMGLEGFWNDMNEIATWGQKLPELIEMDFEGNKATARKGRNIYGMQMARSTYEGAKSLLKGKRPFNLTRAGFSGIQRYAAVWTGDNVSYDEHMLAGVRLVNSMGLTGIAYAGYDVGGFVGNANEHLFARWIQIGAFSPFFRGHTTINSRDAEPWSFGEEVEEISRNYIRLRYKLMPYIYAHFREATISGLPVARSLAIDYTHTSQVYNGAYHNQYLFGNEILVAPVESTKQLTKVYLPQGVWYELFTDKKLMGDQEIIAECPIDQLPLYVKASAIIPLYPGIGRNTTQIGDVLEVHIYKGINENEAVYYEDDGTTYGFEEGSFYQRRIKYDPEGSIIEFGEAEGTYATRMKSIRFCMHGFENINPSVGENQLEVSKESYQFVDPISNFDPMYAAVEHRLKVKGIHVFTLANENNAISIKL